MWLLAVLIGDCISDQGFFDKKMYGHFAGPKKSGCNIKRSDHITEVAVRLGSTEQANIILQSLNCH